MLRTLLDARALVATFVAAVVGVCGLQAFPIARDNLFLAVIDARRPDIALGLAYGYGLLWFSTPFWIVSIAMSCLAIVASGLKPRGHTGRCRPIRNRRTGPEPFLVLGEAHFTDRAGRAPEPRWLTIPQRGCTQVSWSSALWERGRHPHACPYVDQLLAGGRPTRPQGRRAGDGGQGRLLPPVKTILERSGWPTTTSRSG